MTALDEPVAAPTSLDTAAARNLATTIKSAPQMQGISSRWLLRSLVRAAVDGGTYRRNRRLSYGLGDGRVWFTASGGRVAVVPQELTELPPLAGYADDDVLTALAGRFVPRRLDPGEVLAEGGAPIDKVVLVASGKVTKVGAGPYGGRVDLATLAAGDHAGSALLNQIDPHWDSGLTAATPAVVLVLERAAFHEFAPAHPGLQAHLGRTATNRPPRDKYGEAPIALAAGRTGEPVLPTTFVPYDRTPREYPISLVQSVVRVHTRVSDLYGMPMDQTEEQLRLAVEVIKERQEHELLHNPDYGLLNNVATSQRFQTRTGPPGPDDLDELLSRRRRTDFMLAHPRTIAAFQRQCSAVGVFAEPVAHCGAVHTGWRGVPLLPCDKIGISRAGTSAVVAIRTEDDNGVCALVPREVPDEREPGLSVRRTGIDQRGVASYLVTAYQSAVVLVPDALGVLENVELGR